MAANQKKRQTNVECITNIMEFSNYGALAQAFVIDALVKHSDRIAALNSEQFPTNGLVSFEAWQGVAKEIKAKLVAHLGS